MTYLRKKPTNSVSINQINMLSSRAEMRISCLTSRWYRAERSLRLGWDVIRILLNRIVAKRM